MKRLIQTLRQVSGVHKPQQVSSCKPPLLFALLPRSNTQHSPASPSQGHCHPQCDPPSLCCGEDLFSLCFAEDLQCSAPAQQQAQGLAWSQASCPVLPAQENPFSLSFFVSSNLKTNERCLKTENFLCVHPCACVDISQPSVGVQ